MRIFCLAALLLGNVTWMYAQELVVGGRLGTGITRFGGKSEPGLSHKSVMAYTLGGVVGCKFDDMYAVFGELSYGLWGGREKGYLKSVDENGKEMINPYEINARYMMHYINLPVYGKVYFGNPKNVQYFAAAGPYLGILAASTRTYSVGGRKDEINANSSKLFKPLDVGFIIGAGVEFPEEAVGRFAAEIRYNRSFTNISKNSNASLANSVFMLSLAYYLPLK